MNFFEQQHKARKRTWLLVSYFLIAVLLIIIALNSLLFFGLYSDMGLEARGQTTLLSQPMPQRFADFMDGSHWLLLTAAILLVITLRSVVSLLNLGTGGEAVARMVNARRVDMDSQDPGERRLINVVEEMSIASGTPVPSLYVMDEEQAINAFVAGYDADEAVLVVTAGTLATLNRDELQGVVGHEYSHILNGDMRLNVHLISVLAGVLALSQIGGFLLRSMRYSRSGGGRSGGQAMLAIIAIGVALFVLGYVGLFFGRLIKAAVSRQREYLADASAVQFTRNPHGIAGALWKIKQHSSGARLNNLHAEDMSHMCFGETMSYAFTGLFATHPPLDDRIAAVDPNFARWAKSEEALKLAEEFATAQGSAMGSGSASGAPVAASMGFAGGEQITTSAQAITDSVGNPTPAHVAYAEQLHAAIPTVVLRSVHRPAQAPAVIYALLLVHMDEVDRADGADLIRSHHNEAMASIATHLAGELAECGPGLRLPLLDLALPAIKGASHGERERLLKTCDALVVHDEHVSLFEFALTTLVEQYLDPSADDEQIEHTSFDSVLEELKVIFAALAISGSEDAQSQQAAFARGMSGFAEQGFEAANPDHINAQTLRAALHQLRGLSPILKRSVINACGDTVLHDGQVVPEEAELLRAVSATLGCPMPPLLSQ